MRNATPTSRLTQQERHAQILAVLRRDGAVRVATLAKLFDVTTETARRDLDELAGSGALQRTYGGGAMRSLIDEPGIGLRGLVHTPERTRIASAAAQLVQAGDALLMVGAPGRIKLLAEEPGYIVLNGAQTLPLPDKQKAIRAARRRSRKPSMSHGGISWRSCSA